MLNFFGVTIRCMSEKRYSKQTDWHAARRFQAWSLKKQGWKQKDIATALGVTPGAVSQWFKRVRDGGVEALQRRIAPGARPRISSIQLGKLPELLAKGAEHYGFHGDVWTHPRVATVIRRELGVSFTSRHAGRLLTAIGWTRQKPIKRATQRNEVLIQHWCDEIWPQAEKKPFKRVALSYFLTKVAFVYSPCWCEPGHRAAKRLFFVPY